jgi:inosine-uridine nucleoside N-ribohydrolase
MDGGIDDALALILALSSPELEVAGITAVSGNVPVDQATINGLRVVELLDRRDVWVARGLANPLVRDAVRATSFHGKDGLGDSRLPLPKTRPAAKSALDAISDELRTSKRREITLVCTGPLTNMAALLTGFPDVSKKVRELVIMGGAYGVTEYGIGNETPVAEFNIYSDPEAAKIVFESGVPLKAVGLDVTMLPESQLTLREYTRIKKGKGRNASFAVKILEKNMRKNGQFALHDPMAVAVTVKPSFFEFARYGVQIETRGVHTTGMTIADRRNLPENKQLGERALICKGVDSRRFKRLLLDRLIES